MADPKPPREGVGAMVDTVRAVQRQTKELSSPSGTQRFRAVAELELLVSQLAQQVTDLANTIVPGLIDSKVANPGNINPGNINASGSLTAQGALTIAGFITLPGVLVHTNPSFRTLTTGDNGEIGISSSSERYKQDIEDAELSEETFRSIRARRFRYKADVAERGDAALPDVGFIAEELDAVGITEPVFYDSEGQPEGINYDRLTPHLVLMVQQLLDDRDELRTRLTALENGE